MEKQSHIAIKLTAKEWELISTLRGIPPSPLRKRVEALLEDLMEFVRNPHCAEMQADGVPCASVHADCEQCVQVGDMIDSLAINTYLNQKEPKV